MKRRTYIAGIGGTVGTGLAGCLSRDGSTDDPEETDDETTLTVATY